MAHFAQLDKTDTVIQVIVVNNAVLLDEDGVEQESLGVDFCKSLYGKDTKWVQTSYNANFRAYYAGLGFKYDRVKDEFVPPQIEE